MYPEEFQSGQMGQTVNLLLYGFDGPNPSSSTKNQTSLLTCLIFLCLRRDGFGRPSEKRAGGTFLGRGLPPGPSFSAAAANGEHKSFDLSDYYVMMIGFLLLLIRFMRNGGEFCIKL